MSQLKTSQSVETGFCTILLALFVFCKLAGVTAIAAWSWWWILSPIWLPAIIVITVILFCVIVAGIFGSDRY